ATLIANNETKRFAHIDALMQELTGTVLPLSALFDWLIAVPTPAEGWQVDLSQMQMAERPRLFAKRTAPLPMAELRVVLEP
ncbi:MAG TPA: lipoprotein insertase outer membrane protein LolB, partial [Burkholderiaceae bacterium]|nr:lipoprotein insertase outer membrane protein LolB [Burkholderiaceae bacterium]